ncbi:antitoxin [Pseudonocardia sp. DSM 110487]|jgi:MT0933-like antitoxin protein|uniref:antitoxin n=1 Tax=Pseudonocardia sp. DSM 110487 TaxID=2865833 RepID=UPI001C6A4BB4|nr:antitoxin [Pseudonocardia sp. DSM 110487]QYN35719.1 antitoxin [Pseudonocardia sp. DSM 110487]
MALIKRLALLATAAEAARRYAKSNPDKAAKYLDQAAAFVDKQTKGKYSGQIRGAADKAKGIAGIRQTPGYGATGNGYTQGYEQNAGFGKTADYSAPTPPPSTPPQPQPGQAGPTEQGR